MSARPELAPVREFLEQLDLLGVRTLILDEKPDLGRYRNAVSEKRSQTAEVLPQTDASSQPAASPAGHSPKECADQGKERFRVMNRRVSPCEVIQAKQQALDAERAGLQSCQLCPLGTTRSQIVYGVGNPDADLVFVGEAPGADEDRKGEPFVGRAGKLLTSIIEKGMGLKREDVYICNVNKCWPGPGNRTPSLDEMTCCEGFLKAQIRIIEPEVIVALGSNAVKCLLEQPRLAITRVRGDWYEYEGIPLMPTFHPSYLLRNPAAKKDVWEDIKQVISHLNEIYLK
jgi:DNA polymerase